MGTAAGRVCDARSLAPDARPSSVVISTRLPEPLIRGARRLADEPGLALVAASGGADLPSRAVAQICSPGRLDSRMPVSLHADATPAGFPRAEAVGGNILIMPLPLSLQLNGSWHVRVHVLWTQVPGSKHSLLLWQTGNWNCALTSRPPSPSKGPSAPVASPPSICRRGRRVQAFVRASNRLTSIIRHLQCGGPAAHPEDVAFPRWRDPCHPALFAPDRQRRA